MFFPSFFLAPETLSQAINPWSWFFETHASDNQNGLINITTYRSDDREMEHKIIHEVAGYGMQLNVIEDVLEVLLTRIEGSETMPPEQIKAIDTFKEMMVRIQEEKEKKLLNEFSPGGLEKLLGQLEKLKNTDADLYKKTADRLKAAL